MVIRLIPMFSIVDARLQVWPRARSGRPGDFAPLPLPGWSAITRLCEQSARATDDNTSRPPAWIGYLTPAAHAASLTATGRVAARPESGAALPVAHTALRCKTSAGTQVVAG